MRPGAAWAAVVGLVILGGAAARGADGAPAPSLPEVADLPLVEIRAAAGTPSPPLVVFFSGDGHFGGDSARLAGIILSGAAPE